MSSSYMNDSNVMSDIFTSPSVMVSPIQRGGVKRSTYAYLAAGDVLATTVGQTHSVMRLPATARLTGLKAVMATMGNGAFDFDLFATDGTKITTAGSVLADFALTAHTLNSAIDLGFSEANAASDLATLFATAIGTAGKTSDTEFDLVASVVTVSTGASVAIGVEVEYVTP